MRRLRWQRRTADSSLPAGRPKPGTPAARGRIVAPAAGAAVDGVVSVIVEPAQTEQPVDTVRLEWDEGTTWSVAAVLDERTYELELPGGAAIVRSLELAEALGALFETTLETSALRPWPSERRVSLPWNTSELPLGPVSLRAITVDAAGVETATTTVEVEVVPLGEAAQRAAAREARPPVGEQAAPGVPAPRLQSRARRSWAVLEAAIDSHPDLDPWRREALEALLHHLIGYAEPDGTIPEQFDALVEDEFGDLLEVTW